MFKATILGAALIAIGAAACAGDYFGNLFAPRAAKASKPQQKN